MKKTSKFLLILIIFASVTNNSVFAESLFRAGISQNNNTYMQPKPLFSTIRAKNIGDIVTITVSETTETSDDISFSSADTSSTTDKFSQLWNNILPFKPIPSNLSNYGGTSTADKKASSSRKVVLKDNIVAQVVQILPNGNVVVQGKKTTVNAKEKVQFVISGIIDPRFIDYKGNVNSNQVANLQIAVVGNGSISRSNADSLVNRFIRNLF